MIWAVIILALLGVPMFAIFGALAMLAYRAIDIDIAIMIGELTRLTSMPMLQALPMFALAGYLLAGSRASERLLRLTRAAFGWMPGGLAMVTIVTCTFLTAFTGASGVTIVALGGLLLPALLRDGYREKAALGLVTSGGNMGVLFAPSLPLILYAVIAQPISGEVTVDALFRAGILPGLLALRPVRLWRLGGPACKNSASPSGTPRTRRRSMGSQMGNSDPVCGPRQHLQWLARRQRSRRADRRLRAHRGSHYPSRNPRPATDHHHP